MTTTEQIGGIASAGNDIHAKHAALLEKLYLERDWFRSRRLWYYLTWVSLTVLNLSLSFLTSILIALGWPDPGQQPGKGILVALPAIASFCGTLIVHFRLRESWELREMGRIDTEEAIVKAMFLNQENEAEFSTELYKIHMERIQRVRVQATRYFANLQGRAEDSKAPALGRRS